MSRPLARRLTKAERYSHPSERPIHRSRLDLRTVFGSQPILPRSTDTLAISIVLISRTAVLTVRVLIGLCAVPSPPVLPQGQCISVTRAPTHIFPYPPSPTLTHTVGSVFRKRSRSGLSCFIV